MGGGLVRGSSFTTFARRNIIAGMRHHISFRMVLALSLNSALPSAWGQSLDGTLDPGFTPGLGPNGEVFASAIQEDGMVLIGGAFTEYNGTPQKGVARIRIDGSPDPAFVTAGGISGGLGASVNAIKLLKDKSMLIGGTFGQVGGVARKCLAKLKPNGALDTSFDPSAGVDGANARISTLTVQSNDRILIGGTFEKVQNTARKNVARLNADGTLDASFNAGSVSGEVDAVLALPDNRILIGGVFTTIGGSSRPSVAMLNPDGSLTSWTLNSSNLSIYKLEAMILQPDGKLVLGGRFASNDPFANFTVLRANADGSMDRTFNASMASIFDDVKALAVRQDSKILIAGSFNWIGKASRGNIARLQADGKVDNTFYPGQLVDGVVNTFSLDQEGNITLAGEFQGVNGESRKRIARLLCNLPGPPEPGSIDTTFDMGAGPDLYVHAMALQPDGRIVIGGEFTKVDETPRSGIARLNADGSHDLTFNPGAGFQGSGGMRPMSVVSVCVLDDGRIAVGGGFSQVNGVARANIAILEKDGSLNRAFNFAGLQNTKADDLSFSSSSRPISDLVQLPDKNLMFLYRYYDTISFEQYRSLCVVDATGNLVRRITLGDSFFDHVLVANERLYAVGTFTIPGKSMPEQTLIRMSLDGTYDPGFHIDPLGQSGWGSSIIGPFAIQPNGKAITSALYVTANAGVPTSKFYWGKPSRFNPDGTLDRSFVVGGEGQSNRSIERVDSMLFQPDGKIVLAGLFLDRPALVRLLASGEVDGRFATQNQFVTPSISSMLLLPDNKILICGDSRFTRSTKIDVRILARLNNDPPLNWYLTATKKSDELELGLHNGMGRNYNFEVSTDLKAWRFWTNAQSPNAVLKVTDQFKASEAARFYRAKLNP